MHIALWIVAALFAIGFVAGGIVKLTWPYEKYAARLHRPQDFTPGNVKFMGAIDILGGSGWSCRDCSASRPRSSPWQLRGWLFTWPAPRPSGSGVANTENSSEICSSSPRCSSWRGGVSLSPLS